MSYASYKKNNARILIRHSNDSGLLKCNIIKYINNILLFII